MQLEQTLTLPAYYVRQIMEQVRMLGVNTQQWLLQWSLQPEQLHHAYLTIELNLFCAMVRNLVELTHEPGIGLLIGNSLLVNTHGILGYAAMNSATMRQVVELFEQFMVLRTTLVRLRLLPHPEGLVLVFDTQLPLEDVRNVVMEAVVLSIKNVLDFIAMGHCPIQQVRFTASEGNQQLAEQLFHCPVLYADLYDGFLLTGSMLDKPLQMSDPHTFADARQICERELNKLYHQELLSVKVRQLLLERQADFPSLEVVARMLYTTPRTLHRHLKQEGSSFFKILDEVRHLLAVEHLKVARLPIYHIAFILGYADVANFRRAFKRWEGCSPQCFQQRWQQEATPVGTVRRS